MSQKIIIPEGKALLRYLSDGYPICNECGAIMYLKEDPAGICDLYVCPSCRWEIDKEDYEYDDGDLEEKEWAQGMLNMFGGEVPPAGCRGCGGPYPSCKTSCKLFDD